MSPNTPGSRKPIFDLSGAPLAVPETFTDSSEVQLNAKRLLPSFTYVGSLSSYPYFDLRVSNILCWHNCSRLCCAKYFGRRECLCLFLFWSQKKLRIFWINLKITVTTYITYQYFYISIFKKFYSSNHYFKLSRANTLSVKLTLWHVHLYAVLFRILLVFVVPTPYKRRIHAHISPWFTI